MLCPHNLPSSLKHRKHRPFAACLAVLLSVALSNSVFSQETSSAVRGIVSDQGGEPIPGSTVVVRNEQTGLTRTVSTNREGEFSIRNLPVGDNYSVSVTGSGYADRKTQNLPLRLGQPLQRFPVFRLHQ